jgi:hypothetical protein
VLILLSKGPPHQSWVRVKGRRSDASKVWQMGHITIVRYGTWLTI